MIYAFILALHNIMRWTVLITGLLTVFRNWQGHLGKKIWEKDDRLAKTAFVISMDIQFLLGIILYLGLSPLTRQSFSNLSEAMKNPELRFYTFGHFTLMLAAIALAHIGSVKIKKAGSDQEQFKYGSIFFTIALLLIILGIPWTRRLLPL
jgi:hypothetical protein